MLIIETFFSFLPTFLTCLLHITSACMRCVYTGNVSHASALTRDARVGCLHIAPEVFRARLRPGMHQAADEYLAAGTSGAPHVDVRSHVHLAVHRYVGVLGRQAATGAHAPVHGMRHDDDVTVAAARAESIVLAIVRQVHP